MTSQEAATELQMLLIVVLLLHVLAEVEWR